MSTVVHVQNISKETSEKEVRDFFSFCGKITNLSVTPTSDAQSATVTFEKETAAKTALLLDNTQLGPSQVQVTAAANIDQLAAAAGSTSGAQAEDDDIPQDEKPRTRIFAEYLAHGYHLSDQAIQRAIALDSKHGVSNRFTSALTNFDTKYKATDKARGVDASYGITDKAQKGWSGLHSYFEKAINTPTGQKLVNFYSSTEKQVLDVHNEARRLADLKGGKGGNSAPEPVPGTEKTTCNCGGSDGICTCAPGKCACSGCAKSTVTGEHSATGPADTVAASTEVQPLGDKKDEKVQYA